MLTDLLVKNGAGGDKLYVEDVFSTWLYTGTGSAQTITNGIDISGNGGLVWIKGRSGATDHALYDTARGATFDLASNSDAAQTTQSTGLTAFSASGFSIGSLAKLNTNNATYASWTFRKQPKFFDIVTYTGNGANRTIAHNLGSVPGMIIIKRTGAIADWAVYHRSLANTQYLFLNSSAAAATGTTYWNSTTPTATQFSLGTSTNVNANGATYVAYLFAHNAGGFGNDGLQNVISCGSFTPVSNNFSVNLGWEPQYILAKRTTGTESWYVLDNMRGLTVNGVTDANLQADTASAEINASYWDISATGFGSGTSSAFANTPWVYMAIRRGPMKTPTDATKVFEPTAITPTNNAVQSMNFASDMNWARYRDLSGNGVLIHDRLRGFAYGTATSGSQYPETGVFLQTTTTDAENNNINPPVYNVWNSQLRYGDWAATTPTAFYNFQRAPGFFDIACYTGTGSARTVSHNLGAAPELMIVKRRNASADWQVYYGQAAEYMVLNTTDAKTTSNTDRWNNTAPTSTVFSVGTNAVVNASGGTYVAYLFASCPGVSKVGSYTGTGTTLQINCGFTNGARFVLIKRTDSTGDWYVYDSARGIIAGNDPYMLLNSMAAEVTNTDYVDAYAAGFELSSTAPAALNANGGTFIYLAIA